MKARLIALVLTLVGSYANSGYTQKIESLKNTVFERPDVVIHYSNTIMN